MRLVLEVGPKGRKIVAVAPDWPGLERGASTADAAIERLLAYVPRYAPVATLAGVDPADLSTTVNVVEEYAGSGSTDFWGISFALSDIDRQNLSVAELDRQLKLMRSCWAVFDAVRARVSADMQRGPRGGGRERNEIVRHVIRNEQEQWARKLGLRRPELPPDVLPTPAELAAQRDAYCSAIQAFHAEGKMARTWPLRYLIRHTAYHTLDHTWEMEDKDLTESNGPLREPPPYSSAFRP